jgi:hypothetical protein
MVLSLPIILFAAATFACGLLRRLYGQSDGTGKGSGLPPLNHVRRNAGGWACGETASFLQGFSMRGGTTLSRCPAIHPIGAWINMQFTWMRPDQWLPQAVPLTHLPHAAA